MEKHDLLHEFPEMRERIHELKITDRHFRRLFDEYHDVDHRIHSVESGAQSTSDEYLNGLKAERVHLKDTLYQILKN